MLTWPRNFILLLLYITLFGEPIWSQTFSAEIRIAQTRVRYDTAFTIYTAIKNIGKQQETIDVWPCLYAGQWVATISLVQIADPACLQDTLEKITLKPGDAYKAFFPAQIKSSSDNQQRTLTFRLGYGTNAEKGDWKPWPNIAPIWSNAVTVVVIGK